MISKTIDNLLDTKSAAPRPFPGKYPTRIYISSIGKEPFKYIGKPVFGLLQNLKRNFFQKGGQPERLIMYECDQNGYLLSVEGGTIRDQATFWPTYMPVDGLLLRGLARMETFYTLLARQPLDFNGKQMYWPTYFDGTRFEETAKQMLADCGRGKIRDAWFKGMTMYALQDHLTKLTYEWCGVKKPTPKKAPEKLEQKLGRQKYPWPGRYNGNRTVAPLDPTAGFLIEDDAPLHVPRVPWMVYPDPEAWLVPPEPNIAEIKRAQEDDFRKAIGAFAQQGFVGNLNG